MRSLLTLCAVVLLASPLALADPAAFRNIIGDAANIQMDAEAIVAMLKNSKFDQVQVKAESNSLSNHIAALKADVEALDGTLQNLTAAQQKDWELAKTKVDLLQIYSNLKLIQLEADDAAKNRSSLRAHANAVAVRAGMLQRTVNRLDR